MKKLYNLLYFLVFLQSESRGKTGVGPKNITNASVLLDFAVETLPATPANGNFLFDARAAEKKIKMYENGTWVNLSDAGSTTSLVSYSGSVDNAKKTVVGAKESAADGVLVLE